MFEKLFTPFKSKNLELKNKLVVSAMVSCYAKHDGTASEKYIAYHENKAKGGWGLVITEDYCVSPTAGGFYYLPGLWDDSQISSHTELTNRVHAAGGKICAQIYHAGRQTTREICGVQPIAPSPIKEPTMPETPREVTRDEIKMIVKQFGECAERAKKAGFDAVEIHGAHGYLIHEFLTPLVNKRTDEYGGPINNRTRFAVEIIKEVRSKVGKDFPILFRISTTELIDGGITIGDSKATAKIVEAAGVDIIHASQGTYVTEHYLLPPAAVPRAFAADYSAEIKKVVKIPVIGVGRYNDPYVAEAALESDKADLIAMGRASLADPDFPNKVKAGHLDDITYCIGCSQGCYGELFKQKPIKCLMNPRTGRENEFEIKEATEKKKVVVVGGGVAGAEAAIVAAKRGHTVSLYEKADRLGGQWLLAAIPPNKQECNNLTYWQKVQLDKFGVEIHLNTCFNETMLSSENPDTVVIATGATPIKFSIKGDDTNNVVLAEDILTAKLEAEDNVVVIGGGLVGAETAEYLASQGKKVTIIEMLDQIVKGGLITSNDLLFEALEKYGVDAFTSSKVTEITADSVLFEKDGEEHTVKNVKTVVLAVGYRADNTLQEKLVGKVNNVVVVGDAIKARNALDAVEEGYIAGLNI